MWGVNRPPPRDAVPLVSCSSSRSGASGQTPGQWLTYFIRPSWRNDRSIPTWVDGEEEAADGAAEPGPQPIGGSACPPHGCPLHILQRAQTASQAEANVKINNDDPSCSAHSGSHCRAAPKERKPPPTSKMSRSPPSVLSLAPTNTAETSWAARGARARKRLGLMSRLDNEVHSWRNLCDNHSM